jgi:hypothetical protein
MRQKGAGNGERDSSTGVVDKRSTSDLYSYWKDKRSRVRLFVIK